MRIIAVIPAYNEERIVGDVVSRILKLQVTSHKLQVIVVDDGSKDQTAQAAREAGALTVQHPINRGLGAALATGIEGALHLFRHPEGAERLKDPELDGTGFFTPNAFGVQNDKSEIIVTLDADGQHDPAEIPRVVEPIVKREAEAVIGSRFKCKMQNVKCKIPLSRRVANRFGNIVTWLLFGIWVSDSQSGFRAFSAEAAAKLKLRTSTMEVSSEIIREIVRLKLRLKEVPIAAHYTPYSLSKGQGFFRGLETLWKLIVLRFFR